MSEFPAGPQPPEWWARKSHPPYDPIQLTERWSFHLPLSCCDWWGPRSICCGLYPCCSPFLHCVAGQGNCCIVRKVDVTDATMWNELLKRPSKVPEALRGVWWFEDSNVGERLISFNDSEWVGDDKQGDLWKPMGSSWSRDSSCFGSGLAIGQAFNGCCTVKGFCRDAGGLCCRTPTTWASIWIKFNLEAGKAAFASGSEWAFQVSEDQWEKIWWAGENTDENQFYYRWSRVISADGTTTPHWDRFVKKTTEPYPHRNFLEPYCCLWPLCLTRTQKQQDMACPNRYQLVIWPWDVQPSTGQKATAVLTPEQEEMR